MPPSISLSALIAGSESLATLSSARRVRLSAAGALVLTILLPGMIRAHAAADERFRILDEQIAEDPGNARLYLTRGNLHLDEKQFDEALTDFASARERDGSLGVVALLEARAQLGAGRQVLALMAIHSYLASEPASAAGWLMRARIEVAGGEVPAAIAAYDRYFSVAREPRPNEFLERAGLHRAAGDLASGVRGLEEGVRRLGPLIALLQARLVLEREAGDLEACLATIDRLFETSSQKERWLVQRAAVLLDLERVEEARSTLQEAADLLAGRPVSRRSTPALVAAGQELREQESRLAELAQDPIRR